MNFRTLGIREIIASIFALGFAATMPVSYSHASLVPDLSAIGTIEALNAMGTVNQAGDAAFSPTLNHLPLRFEGMARPVLFSVDPGLKTLLVSREFIAEHNLWDYRFEREVSLPAASGGMVPGDLVHFYVLMVGTQALRNVQAIVCDECTETAGQSVLNQLEKSAPASGE